MDRELLGVADFVALLLMERVAAHLMPHLTELCFSFFPLADLWSSDADHEVQNAGGGIDSS